MLNREEKTKLSPEEVHKGLNEALKCSRCWANESGGHSNSTCSARFTSDACKKLTKLVKQAFPTSNPRYISLDNSGKRGSGEWLLDGVWTEDRIPDRRTSKPTPVRIRCALECESSTRSVEYFTDLGKLLVVASDIKIFLAGLRQRKRTDRENYIGRRVCQTQKLLVKESSTDWYLAFWPAPTYVEVNKEKKPLWKLLECNEEFSDLKAGIILYRLVDGKFKLVASPN